jgi:DNA primase
MIPQSFIQDLLYRVDIAELVGRYVQLKKTGANLTGLCPFHREKSPSFSVNQPKQFYHCFGCGAHGSAISFLMEHLGLPFPEAVEQLASQQGIEVPYEKTDAAEVEQRSRQLTLVERMNIAQGFYAQSLKRYPQAIEYLKQRGLTGVVAKRFGLGFAPPGYQGLSTAFSDYESTPDLIECGLVLESESSEGRPARRYDRFRERVTFPIRNIRGDIIGFGGRVIGPGEPKYLNSPETPLFSKGQELYGLFEARSAIRAKAYALVTEGYMDVVALAQWGFENAVATLGTAVTPHHVQRLFRQTDRVVFSFDGDTAGRKAAWRALEASLQYAGENRRIEFLFLPVEHDPDSFIREMGAEAFDQAVNTALPLSVYLMQEMARRHPLGQVEGRAAGVGMLRPLLQQVPAGAYRVALVRSLADQLAASPAELEQQLGLRKKDGGAMQYTPNRRPAGAGSGGTRAKSAEPERRLGSLVLAAPQFVGLCNDLRTCFASSVAGLRESRASLAVLLSCIADAVAQGSTSTAQLTEQFRGTLHEAWVDGAVADSPRLDERLDFETEIQSVMYQCLDGWMADEISALISEGLTTDEMRVYYRDLTEKRQFLKNIRVSKI